MPSHSGGPGSHEPEPEPPLPEPMQCSLEHSPSLPQLALFARSG